MLARAWQVEQLVGSSMLPRSIITSTVWAHTKQRKNACVEENNGVEVVIRIWAFREEELKANEGQQRECHLFEVVVGGEVVIVRIYGTAAG